MKKSFDERLSLKQKRILSSIVIILFILFSAGIFFLIGRPMIKFVSEPEKFRMWVDSHGFTGKIVFILMVVFQVIIAIIPGEPLEIGAGYAFGAIEGTILCMIGILLGSMTVFALVKRIGVRLLEVFFSIEKIHSLKFLNTSKKLNTLTIILLLIPGTPKDLISYFIGLTDMKWKTWMIICLVARTPSVITSTLAGSKLSGMEYKQAIIVFVVTAVMSIIGIVIYKIISNKMSKTKVIESRNDQS